ncbi:MAG: thiamine pyrophosphate-requiring protein [Rhodospirillales bacterium]|jgi:acetolactate synthase-1/2/3 large subunit
MDEGTRSAAEVFLGRLKEAGIDVLLANGGTDFPSIIEAYARAPETGIAMPEPLVVPHESVAVAMAHGHWLVSGRPAAVMVHVNVGLANAAMGLVNAASDFVPLLMLSGRTPVTEGARFGARSSPIHWGQEMRDQGGMVRELVKWDYEMRYPEQAGGLVERAMAIAMSDPKGPVYLSLPREALAEQVVPSRPGPLAPARMGAADAAAVAEAAALIAGARAPVVITQGPAPREGFEPLAGFVDRWALPTVEFWALRQALPTDHPMHAGRDPVPWLKDADVVVVIDALVPWIAGHVTLPEGCRVVGIGADPLFGRTPSRGFPVHVPLVGDTAATVRALDAALAARPPVGEGLAARRALVAARRDETAAATAKRVQAGRGRPMSAAWVSHCLSEAKDEDAAIFTELGCDVSVMRFDRPRSFFSTPLSGGLGWGMAAALGAKLADRSRQVIATVGDGSYMFANPVACHQTAAAHGLPILTVVFNNGLWNAVRRATLGMYPKGRAAAANVMPITALDPAPDHAAIARAHGAHAERVEDPDALPDAIRRALDATRGGTQALLDVVVGV